jgi:hypothetical protein
MLGVHRSFLACQDTHFSPAPRSAPLRPNVLTDPGATRLSRDDLEADRKLAQRRARGFCRSRRHAGGDDEAAVAVPGLDLEALPGQRRIERLARRLFRRWKPLIGVDTRFKVRRRLRLHSVALTLGPIDKID